MVPCGRCDACLVRLRQEWTYRLREEERICADSYFITLTYSNENLPIREYVEEDTGACFYDASVNKRDVQLFNKRFRKELSKLGIRTRFYLISEYGPRTQRPHYHGIYFLDSVSDKDTIRDIVAKCWSSPNITVAEVTEERIKYVTEYCLVRHDIPDYLEPNFRLMSRNPGIGANYVDKMKRWHLADDSRMFCPDYEGNRCNMPRYYREKIYDKETLDLRAAELSLQAQNEELELAKSLDFDYAKIQEHMAAVRKTYHDRVYRYLNKKQKHL